MWTRFDDDRLDQRLRELLSDHVQLDMAIRTMHTVDRIGKLHLCHAVERVASVSPLEAKMAVARACTHDHLE